jgi:DNA-binding CsgD family transcriptional regulator
MATARVAESTKAGKDPGGSSADLQALVQALVGQLVAQGVPPGVREIDGESQDLLFDKVVGGLRLILIRPKPTPCRTIIGHGLSPREREIARMVAKGYPNKTIAAVLEISNWTVGTYLRRTFAKLGVGTRAAMVAKLIAEDLLSGAPSGFEANSRKALP